MSSELKDPAFHARLTQMIGNEKPFAWAERMDISKGAFSRIWNEGTVPGPEHLRRIHEKTGYSIDWMLTGQGPEKRGEKGEQAPATGVNEASQGYGLAPEMVELVRLLDRYGNKALVENVRERLMKIKQDTEG